MDFVKKFAEEQLQKQMGGGDNNNQNQQQGSGQGYGNEQSSNYGQQQEQSSGGGGWAQQAQGFMSQAGFGGQQNQNQNQNQSQYGGQQGSGQFGVTGGPQYNAPHGSGGAGNSFGAGPQIDSNEAMQAASQHGGEAHADSSLFSQAFSFIGNMNKEDDNIDEDKVQQEHKQAYENGNAGNMPASAIGSAAALQAIKQFTTGSSPAAKQAGGGDMMSKIIGMALSEAAKMFDKSGGAASGDKQDAMNSAAQTVMKLMVKNQVSGMMGGGQSGGLGSLMSMAGKFM